MKKLIENIKKMVRKYESIVYAMAAAMLPLLSMLIVRLARRMRMGSAFSLFFAGKWESLLSKIAAVKAGGLWQMISFGSGDPEGFDFIVGLSALLPFNISASVLISTLLFTALVSLCTYFALKYHGASCFSSLLSSLMYSLCSYSFVSQNIFGASTIVLMLPLCLIASRLTATKAVGFPLAIVLGGTILLNARAGWFLIFASAAWYLCISLTEKQHSKKFERSDLALIIALVTGVLIGMPTFVPAIRDAFVKIDLLGVNFDFLGFFAKMLPSVSDGVRAGGLPFVWFGICSVLCLPVFFTSKNIDKKEKSVFGVLLLLTFITMSLSILNVFTDFFAGYSEFSYIQTTLLGFVITLMTAKVLDKHSSNDSTVLYLTLAIAAIILLIIQKVGVAYYDDNGQLIDSFVSDIDGIWVTLVLLFIFTFILKALFSQSKDQRKSTAVFALCAVVIFEMVFGNVKLLKSFQKEYGYTDPAAVSQFYSSFDKANEFIKSKDLSWYRAEKVQSTASADVLLTELNGVVSVGADEYTQMMLSYLGIRTEDGSNRYSHISAALDSLLGISYLADTKLPEPDDSTEKEEQKKEDPGKLELVKDTVLAEQQYGKEINMIATAVSSIYESVYEDENTELYYNPYSLGAITAFAASLADVDLALPTEADLVYDEVQKKYVLPSYIDEDALLFSPADRLNKIWSILSGINDLKVMTELNCSIYELNTNSVIDSIGQTYYSCKDPESATEPHIKISARINQPMQVLFTLPCISGRQVDLYITENNEDRYLATLNKNNKAENTFVNLGYFESGTTLQLKIKYQHTNDEGGFYLYKDKPMLYTSDDVAFANAYYHTVKQTAEITSVGKDFIKASMTVTDASTHVFTPLAYRDGYTVKVNGNKVQTYESAGAFLGFDLPGAGSYSIEIIKTGEKDFTVLTALSILGWVAAAAVIGYEAYTRFACNKANKSKD